MRHYSIYTLDDRGCPQEKWQVSSDSLDEQRQYLANFEKLFPGKAFWICDNQTGELVW